MNISDEELATFIKNSKRSGESVEKNDIIGMWEFTFTGTDIQYYDFQKSCTFRREIIDHVTNPFYIGDIIVKYSLGGTWYLKGDSLILKYFPETAEAQIDRSNITYTQEMQDSVDSYINRWFQVNQLKESLRNSFKIDTFCVSINKSGDKIEMIVGRNNSSEGAINSFYLKRTKNLTW